MGRKIVTMHHLNAFSAAVRRFLDATASGAEYALAANAVAQVATAAGNVDGALQIGVEAIGNLLKLDTEVCNDLERAAVAFTGERRKSRESIPAYIDRISAACENLDTLQTMLKRNGLRFIPV